MKRWENRYHEVLFIHREPPAEGHPRSIFSYRQHPGGKNEIFKPNASKDLTCFTHISMESSVKRLKIFEKEGLIEMMRRDACERCQIFRRDVPEEISRRG